MTRASGRLSLIARVFLGAAGLQVLGGCGPSDYKQDADDRVYATIDEKWQDEFGSRANYRISDTPPLADDIQIDPSDAVSGVLSLPRAVALATTFNREYQTQKETLYTTALDLQLVRHDFETRLFGGGSAVYLDGGRDETVEVEANVGFNRLTAVGTQITMQLAAAWLEVLSGSGDGGLSSIFSAAVAQPLLRGSDRAIVLEDLTQAERDTLYEIRSFNRFRKQFVVSVISQYYEVVEQLELADHAQRYVVALDELEGRVAPLVQAGRLPVHELDRIRQENLRAQDTYIQSRRAYERALDALKITLGVRTTADIQLDATVLNGLRDRRIPMPDVLASDAIEAALSRRLDMANSADAVLDAERKVYVAADQLRAELNLIGGVDIRSNGNDETMGGAVLDLPLDRAAEQNVYRKALIGLNQRRRDYDLAADTVRLEVRDAHRKLTEAAERYEVLSEQLTLAQERIEKVYALLDYVRVSSRRALQAQQDLFDARSEATDALVDYLIATLEFHRDTGVLRVRPDGMWEL